MASGAKAEIAGATGRTSFQVNLCRSLTARYGCERVREPKGATAKGSEDEIDDAFREYASALWRAVYVFSGGHGDVADDAVAEAFTRALPRWHAIRDPRSWLYRVAFRVAATEMKERHRREGEVADTQVAVGEGEELGHVMAALRLLPPRQRAAIVLHYRLDMSVRDIARALDVSTATVRVHLHRGRERLRDLLREEPEGV